MRFASWFKPGVLGLLVVALVGAAAAQQPQNTQGCVQAPAGIVSWWTADGLNTDGKLPDHFGHHPGTLHGSPLPSVVPDDGVANSLAFNGSNGVKVPHHASIDFGPGEDFTLDLWVKTTSTKPVADLLDKRDAPLGGDRSIGYALFLAGGKPGFQLGHSVSVGGIPASYTNWVSNASVSDGGWHLVAVTVDRDNVNGGKLYVDGNLVLTFNPTAYQNTANTRELLIGLHPAADYNPAYNFEGQMDEIELFKRVLAQEEIQAIYNAGMAGKCKGCATPPEGMVAWWSGENNWLDRLNLNPITDGNAGYAPGKVGTGFSFGNSKLIVPNDPSLEPAHVTVDAWVKSNGPGTWGYIAGKGAFTSNCTASSYALYAGSNGALYFYIAGSAVNSTWTLSPAPAAADIWDDRWHHVAGTYDGTYVRLYVDGVQVGTGRLANAPIGYSSAAFNNNFYLGQWPSATCALPYNGLSDEVEVFNRALTEAEIRSIYNAAAVGKCIPPPPNHKPTAVIAAVNPTACTASGGTSVTLDGTGSSDPDGDTLTYNWTWNGGSATGATPTISLPLGTTTVQLVVNDGQLDSDPVTVNATVSVQVAGLFPPMSALGSTPATATEPAKPFKFGRTVPLKLQLSCGGAALGSGDISAPEITAVFTAGNDLLDDAEDAIDAGSANDNGTWFRYDPVAQQWIFNLGTSWLAPGPRYEVEITLPDGSKWYGAFKTK